MSSTFGTFPLLFLRLGRFPCCSYVWDVSLVVLTFGTFPLLFLRLGRFPCCSYVWDVSLVVLTFGTFPLLFLRLGRFPCCSYVWDVSLVVHVKRGGTRRTISSRSELGLLQRILIFYLGRLYVFLIPHRC